MSLDRALQLQQHSWNLLAAAKFDMAFAACLESLRLMEQSEGPVSPDVANLLNDLAEIESAREHFSAALTLTERAGLIQDALGDRFTGEAAAQIRGRTLALAGDARRMQADYPGAERDLRMALTTAVAAFGQASAEAAEARNNLGVLYKYWGRFDDGLQLYREALHVIAAARGEASLEVATVHHNIGGILHARGDFAASEEPARTAWDISRRLLGDEDPRTMLDAAAYAAILDGRFEESEAIFRRALGIFERTYGGEHGEVAATLHNLAAVVASRGDRAEAERCYRRALAIRESTLSVDAPDLALTRNNLGKLLTEMERPDEALPLLEAAVAILESHLTPRHPHLVLARENLRNATHDCRPVNPSF
jgi:tetratricopeptide (TPR) repeat protein